MNRIDGNARTIRQLLKGAKYTVDYYQREYSWQEKQVEELLDDLADKFLADYDPKDARRDVQQYGHYFLGSIIVSEKDGKRFIVDGQQRLTTITLLLMLLRELQQKHDDRVAVDELIFSEQFGQKSFNLDVPDRNACMMALFNGQSYDVTNQSESIANIAARFEDLKAAFPENLKGKVLPYFIDWLIENVHLVEITAYSDSDAYTIFETMNDRGLSLTPTDMLKGYLLANIQDSQERLQANTRWKELVSGLQKFGKEEDADCIKAWLRGQHAEKIRERRRDAVPEDFDKIGTELHRWVKDNEELLRLNDSAAFADFINRDLSFYAAVYGQMREASRVYNPSLGSIYFNALGNFNLQYPLIVAALREDDGKPVIFKKLQMVSRFVEIYLARRMWNFKSIDYNTVNYPLFGVMKDIRRKDIAELGPILEARLAAEGHQFSESSDFTLTGSNRKSVKRLLARMTEYIEVESGLPSQFENYLERSSKSRFEVEHIWANHYEQHLDEFSHPNDFATWRNKIGGLLLLPRSFNASYGDLPYKDKLEHYPTQNLLARSLHPIAYEHHPGFEKFVAATKLDFKPIGDFSKEALQERQLLYVELAKRVWDPKSISAIATASP